MHTKCGWNAAVFFFWSLKVHKAPGHQENRALMEPFSRSGLVRGKRLQFLRFVPAKCAKVEAERWHKHWFNYLICIFSFFSHKICGRVGSKLWDAVMWVSGAVFLGGQKNEIESIDWLLISASDTGWRRVAVMTVKCNFYEVLRNVNPFSAAQTRLLRSAVIFGSCWCIDNLINTRLDQLIYYFIFGIEL